MSHTRGWDMLVTLPSYTELPSNHHKSGPQSLSGSPSKSLGHTPCNTARAKISDYGDRTLSQVPKQSNFWRKPHLYFYSQWVIAFNPKQQGKSQGKSFTLNGYTVFSFVQSIAPKDSKFIQVCKPFQRTTDIQSRLLDKFRRLWKCKRGERTFAECSLKARIKIWHKLRKRDEGSWKISTLDCIYSPCAKLLYVVLVPCHINFTRANIILDIKEHLNEER